MKKTMLLLIGALASQAHAAKDRFEVYRGVYKKDYGCDSISWAASFAGAPHCEELDIPYCLAWISPVVANARADYTGVHGRAAFVDVFLKDSTSNHSEKVRAVLRTQYIAYGKALEISLPGFIDWFDQMLLNVPNVVLDQIEGGVNAVMRGMSEFVVKHRAKAAEDAVRMQAIIEALRLLDLPCAENEADLAKMRELYQAELRGQLRSYLLKN